MPDFAWYVGIDWGGAAHQVCLMDATGAIHGERVVAHTTSAVHEAMEWLRGRTGAAPDAMAVGLETPRGVLVDAFLEQGFCVFALNPKQLDRFRDRFTAGGAKDDRRDAHAVADGVRTDRRAFRVVRPEDPAILHLRELCRIVEELREEESALANRLRDQRQRVHAAWLTRNAGADEPWLWTVLSSAPHPDAWPALPRRQITRALREHGIRRLTPDEVTNAVRQSTRAAAPGVADAVATRIASLIPRVVLVHQQRTRAERQIDRLLDRLAAETGEGEHRDVEILRSLPGVGRMVTATMLAEASGLLATRDYATLRAYSGAAPVTKRSGKRTFVVHMRYACKQRLRQALYHWSRTSIQHDRPARTYYDAARARGHSHARALRSVADRWLRILIAMLNARTLYDASRFTTAPVTA